MNKSLRKKVDKKAFSKLTGLRLHFAVNKSTWREFCLAPERALCYGGNTWALKKHENDPLVSISGKYFSWIMDSVMNHVHWILKNISNFALVLAK